MTGKVRVDFKDLLMAFGSSDGDLMYYLDLENGHVLLVTHDLRYGYDRVAEEAEEAGITFDEALSQSDLPEWMKEGMADVVAVEERLGTTVIDIPGDDTQESYDDMAAFVETMADGVERERLRRALAGKGAFRRFKDALAELPAERERWFEFEGARVRQRILRWCQENGIEVVNLPGV